MSDHSLKPIVVIGGGGHASVLVDILRSQGREIVGIVCPDDVTNRDVFSGLAHYIGDESVFQFETQEVLLVNGIGVLPHSTLKTKLNQFYLSRGYQFETVIAQSAQISPYAKIEQGAQVFPNALINAGAIIGSHTIINSAAVIEHDCNIGQYNHIAPRATLCGQVKSAENVYVGAGATVIQNIALDAGAVVGAGSVVTQNLMKNEINLPSRATIKPAN